MVKIITKDYCPYCDMAKTLIKSLGFDYEEIDVTNNQDKLNEVIQISGMMTVPQIFKKELIKEDLLGGYTDIEALNNDGKLIELIK